MPDRAGGAKRDEVTGKYETAVAPRSAGTDFFPFKNANTFAGLGQIIGAGQSDHTAVIFHFAVKSPVDPIAAHRSFRAAYEKGAGVSTRAGRIGAGRVCGGSLTKYY